VPPAELVTEAAEPVLLVGELGREIRPEAFASTILPRPPTVTTTSPRVAAAVCTADWAGGELWYFQIAMPAINAPATKIPRSA
jgi:hypothetical protein